MTKIVFTSDCHGKLKKEHLPEGDVLCLAGDILPNFSRDPEIDAKHQERALRTLDETLADTHFKHVILVAGNHDWIFQINKATAKSILKKCIYLEDEAITLDGIKYYGSPWQPWFYDWAFNLPRKGEDLKARWAAIPDDTDVLITHGPPYGILDQIVPSNKVWTGVSNRNREHLGCELLAERVSIVKPKVHAFGHIHGSFGRKKVDNTIYLNVALCDEGYSATNRPLELELIKE